MIDVRDRGLIGGIGLSNVSHTRLLHALQRTDIVCVQNAYNLIDRSAQPVLDECLARGIAFVPYFPLGAAFTRGALLDQPAVLSVAARLRATPAQVAQR